VSLFLRQREDSVTVLESVCIIPWVVTAPENIKQLLIADYGGIKLNTDHFAVITNSPVCWGYRRAA